MDTWVAIVNAKAGTAADEVVEEVLGVLRAKVDVTVFYTDDLDDLTDAVDAARDGVAAVIGGDGSINAVVTAIDAVDAFDDVRVAIIPMGTGNDYARTFDIGPDPVTAALQALTAIERRADVIRDQAGRVVVNAVHVGLGAESVEHAEPWKKKLGRAGYVAAAIWTGVVGKGVNATVNVDGEPLPAKHRIVQVAVGTGRHIGGGAPIFPDADPFDGKLDLAVSWSEPRLKRLGYAWRLRRGRHPLRDDVVYLKAEHVSVMGDPMRADLDGELCDEAARFDWRVEPARLRLLVPVTSEVPAPSLSA